MKKRISLFLAAAMMLSFFGCASTTDNPLRNPGTTTPTEAPVQTSAPDILHDAPPTEATTAPTTAAATEVTEATEPVETTEDTRATEAAEATEVTVPTEDAGQDYVLNTNTRKFHYPSCSSAARIKASNRKDFHGTREEIIQMGYEPCKNCNP